MGEIERQLRHYADAAVVRVPGTPRVSPRRSWRPIVATAAAVLLIAGPLTVFLATRDDGTELLTTPADEPVGPPIRTECPTPDTDPQPGHLQMMLPWVTSAREETTSSNFDGLHVVALAPDTDRWIEVRVRADEPPSDLLAPPPDASTVTVSLCDPFSFGDGSPVQVTASITRSADGDRSMTLPASDRWTISLRTGPEATSSVTMADLAAIVGGMAWPQPWAGSTGEPGEDAAEGNGPTTTMGPEMRCAPDPDTAIEVGSFVVTAVPEGFEPRLPVEETDSGPVDVGGGSTATLTLVRPGGGNIQVTTFGAESPSAYIARIFEGAVSDNANVRRCIPTEEGWMRTDNLAVIGTDGGRTMLAAQEWEYEGYLVIGSPGTTREDLVEVAEGLRFGSG